MRKLQLKLWTSARRTLKQKVSAKVLELKDDRFLFARLLIVARSRPDIDLGQAIGTYEFTTLPRALFTADGSLVACTDKSKLMGILESLPNSKQDSPVTSALPDNPNNALTESKKVAVLDGMALVQELGIRKGTKSCLELASAFIYKLCLMTKGHDEIHLVFDRYDLQMSLKDATRARRVLGTKTITYHVTDSTSLTNVTAKQFLAGNKTKDELTTYLANKTSQHF